MTATNLNKSPNIKTTPSPVRQLSTSRITYMFSTMWKDCGSACVIIRTYGTVISAVMWRRVCQTEGVFNGNLKTACSRARTGWGLELHGRHKIRTDHSSWNMPPPSSHPLPPPLAPRRSRSSCTTSFATSLYVVLHFPSKLRHTRTAKNRIYRSITLPQSHPPIPPSPTH